MSNRRFRNMLETQDCDRIEKYFSGFLTRRKAEKPAYFYHNLVLTYGKHPEIIKNIIDNVHKLGYWKDLFLIMEKNKDEFKIIHESLDAYIYKILLKQINLDIINFENGKKITTLAKWLPRRGKRFDKSFHFVPIFSGMMFPDKNCKWAKILYRKTIVKLSESLNIPERNMCEKKMGEIDFSRMSPICFKSNYRRFINNPDSRKQLYNYLFKKYSHFSLSKLINVIMNKKVDKFESTILRNVWKQNIGKFSKQLYFDKEYIEGFTIILDVTGEIQSTTLLYYAIGESILMSMINGTNKIVINHRKPRIINFEEIKDIFTKTKMVKEHILSYSKINIDEYLEKYQQIIILTTKNIKISSDNMILWKMEKSKYYVNFEEKLITGTHGKIFDLNYTGNKTEKVKEIITKPRIENIPKVEELRTDPQQYNPFAKQMKNNLDIPKVTEISGIEKKDGNAQRNIVHQNYQNYPNNPFTTLKRNNIDNPFVTQIYNIENPFATITTDAQINGKHINDIHNPFATSIITDAHTNGKHINNIENPFVETMADAHTNEKQINNIQNPFVTSTITTNTQTNEFFTQIKDKMTYAVFSIFLIYQFMC